MVESFLGKNRLQTDVLYKRSRQMFSRNKYSKWSVAIKLNHRWKGRLKPETKVLNEMKLLKGIENDVLVDDLVADLRILNNLW